MSKLYAAYVRSITQTQCNPAGLLFALLVICLIIGRFSTVIMEVIHIATICVFCAAAVAALVGTVAGIVWLIRGASEGGLHTEAPS